MQKVRILVVSSPALSQVIEHIFQGQSDFEVVGAVSGLRNLRSQSERLLPELIVADVKPLRSRVSKAVSAIKQSSPFSKLILICSIPEFMTDARRCGADACLEQEKVVHQLLRTASGLCAPSVPQKTNQVFKQYV